MTISHLVGIELVVHGRHARQVCSWCGEKLVDVDLSLVAVSPGSGEYSPFWPAGKWLEVTSGNPTVMTVVQRDDGGKFPVNSCMARDVPGDAPFCECDSEARKPELKLVEPQ